MVFLLHGFIASGKTTLAKKIEHEKNAIRISPDEWMRKLYGVNPPADKFNDYLKSIIDLTESIWIPLTKKKMDVILDFGFWTMESRIEIEDKLKSKDIAFSWAVADTPIDECKERNRLRHSSRSNVLNISDDTFDLLLKGFEPWNEKDINRMG